MSITLLRYKSLNNASERASKKRTRIRPMFCDVVERHAIYFHRFSMAGCDKMVTYRHINDDNETDSDDTEIVGAVYRFEPYLAMPDGVDSAIAADDAN